MNRLLLLLLLSVNFLFAQVIHVNQIGFSINAPKKAVYVGPSASEFSLCDSLTNEVVHTDTLKVAKMWNAANEEGQIADFSDFVEPGTYYVKVGSVISYSFEIKEKVYEDILKGILKSYYFNRAGIDLESEYAGEYARKTSSKDNESYILKETAEQILLGSNISIEDPYWNDRDTFPTPKGWYDAGDYGRYIVNSGVATYGLMALYEHFPVYFDTLTWNIPESSNDVPDLLDEVRWNLEWMLSMQDPNDGGVFYKVTTKNFVSTVMPEDNKINKYVMGKDVRASLIFSGTLAMASRIYVDIDSAFASQCLIAAKKAYQWADLYWKTYYTQPSSVNTGSYGAGTTNDADEYAWAAGELFLARGVAEYFLRSSMGSYIPTWDNYYANYAYDVLFHQANFEEKYVTAAKKAVNNISDQQIELGDNGYELPLPENFSWGSNGNNSFFGMNLLQSFYDTDSIKYFNAAHDILDYIFGRNPVGYTYITGYGDKPVENIHHRTSEADGIEGSVPGFMPGGPNSQNSTDGCNEYKDILAPAKSYHDAANCYSLNENAINYQAGIAYLAGAIAAIESGADVDKSYKVPEGDPVSVYKNLKTSYKNNFSYKENMIYLNNSGINNVKIYTASGKNVFGINSNFKAGESIDLSNIDLANGFYHIRVVYKNSVETLSVAIID